MESSTELTKNRAAKWSSSCTPGYTSEKNKKHNLKKYMHPNVYCSTVYNSQDAEVT